MVTGVIVGLLVGVALGVVVGLLVRSGQVTAASTAEARLSDAEAHNPGSDRRSPTPEDPAGRAAGAADVDAGRCCPARAPTRARAADQ